MLFIDFVSYEMVYVLIYENNSRISRSESQVQKESIFMIMKLSFIIQVRRKMQTVVVQYETSRMRYS